MSGSHLNFGSLDVWQKYEGGRCVTRRIGKNEGDAQGVWSWDGEMRLIFDEIEVQIQRASASW